MATRRVAFSGSALATALVTGSCGSPVSEPAPAAAPSAIHDVAPLYFPPSDGRWETVDPADAGWDAAPIEAAIELAGDRNSTSVVLLHRGRIMAERHWAPEAVSEQHRRRSHGVTDAGHAIEDVASVQKSVVAVLVGMAQHRGLLSLDNPVSDLRVEGWTAAPLAQERSITVRHLLDMTTGLTPELEYDAMPGTTWFYNTPAYHHLMRIVAKVANQSRDEVTRAWLTDRIGMRHSRWQPRPGGNPAIGVGLATSARDLARFGLLIQANGEWNGETIVEDKGFLGEMLRPSQTMNRSYGLLWWVNGQASSMSWAVPSERSDGALIPPAPADLVAAQGALDRKLYIVPSLDLVVTRLGDVGSVQGSSFNDAFWELLIEAAPER